MTTEAELEEVKASGGKPVSQISLNHVLSRSVYWQLLFGTTQHHTLIMPPFRLTLAYCSCVSNCMDAYLLDYAGGNRWKSSKEPARATPPFLWTIHTRKMHCQLKQ